MNEGIDCMDQSNFRFDWSIFFVDINVENGR